METGPVTVDAEARIAALESLLGDADLGAATLATLEGLTLDEVNLPGLLNWIRTGVELDDRRWEIRGGLRAVAQVLQPRNYLEIGTRRAWSLSQVLAESRDTQAYSFDMWIEGYGSVDNPGPDFVRSELARVAPGHRPVEFVSGNSHDTLPAFFARADRPAELDLVTVDGDHTAVGTWWDLLDVLPHVAVGGAVVMDDLYDLADELYGDQAVATDPDRHPPLPCGPSLMATWTSALEQADGLFEMLFTPADPPVAPPVAIAIRVE